MHGAWYRRPARSAGTPGLRRYFIGANAVAEEWTLRFTEWSWDRSVARFVLAGSMTGPDGEGEIGKDFVSHSGRIRLPTKNWAGPWPKPEIPEGVTPDEMTLPPPEAFYRWRVELDGCDTVTPKPWYDTSYITVADGLPAGQHTLTLAPAGDKPPQVLGYEVYCPPWAGR